MRQPKAFRVATLSTPFLHVIIILVVLSSSVLRDVVVEAQCTLCENDAAPANIDKIIPFLGTPDGNSNPTCGDLQKSATSFPCDLTEGHQAFCGCPGTSSTPLNACSLCDGELEPGRPDSVTPFGDTCAELDEYMSFLSPRECGTNRVKLIDFADYFCRCPGAEPGCPMCSDGTSNIRNGDFIIPLFGNSLNGEPPTCRDLSDFGLILVDEGNCEIVTEEANFCGCADAVGESTACSLCAGGAAPGRGDNYKVFESTCNEIDRYLKHQSADRCASDERMQVLKEADWVCGCPGATTTCPICPDGTSRVNNGDKYIPLLGLPPANSPTTCHEMVNYVALLADDESFTEDLCGTYQAYAGFCGCSDVAPKNSCSFCPNGGSVSDPNKLVHPLYTCGDLERFISHFDDASCANEAVMTEIQAFAFRCGCPDTTPSCTLCPNNKATGDDSEECILFAESVTSLTKAACDSGKAQLAEFAKTCKCPSGGSMTFSSSTVAFVFVSIVAISLVTSLL